MTSIFNSSRQCHKMHIWRKFGDPNSSLGQVKFTDRGTDRCQQWQSPFRMHERPRSKNHYLTSEMCYITIDRSHNPLFHGLWHHQQSTSSMSERQSQWVWLIVIYGLPQGMGSANQGCYYNVKSTLIGWTYIQNGPCVPILHKELNDNVCIFMVDCSCTHHSVVQDPFSVPYSE